MGRGVESVRRILSALFQVLLDFKPRAAESTNVTRAGKMSHTTKSYFQILHL